VNCISFLLFSIISRYEVQHHTILPHPQFGTVSSVAARIAFKASASGTRNLSSMILPIVEQQEPFQKLIAAGYFNGNWERLVALRKAISMSAVSWTREY